MLKGMRVIFTLMLVLAAMGVNAQFTTSSMSGKVEDMQKEPIIGATIQAIHEASGTRYGAITNVDGRFSIQGMRTGKYTVEVSFIGYQSVKVTDATLQLGVNYPLDIYMKESSELLDEVVVVGTASKFAGVKTGAVTNVSSDQMQLLPSIDRSLSDFTRLSPYSGANNTLSGRDGRTNTFTIDGANLNNNFGLSSTLPGGGNPISLDAIEELQVVVAPFDVRQTNFVGGGVNAITKSGTNMFKGSAYTYQKNENFRGNKVDGYDLGVREKESKEVYGFTFGGPIIKNKLFFFVNGEYENQPQPITKWKLSTDGKSNADQMISRVTPADMKEFSDLLQSRYGYNPGSYTDYDGGTKNYKFLGRIDWNITDAHKLSVRYNYTTNTKDLPANGTSTVGDRASSNRISKDAMAFVNNCYAMENNVWSLAAELNSRFGNNLANRFLFTYSNIEDVRTSESSPFPHIDIWDGAGNAFMSAGYELFSWNNAVKNNILNIQDNVTWTLGSHKIIGGFNFEYQKASNSFMRYGTGYYKFNSFEDFKNGAAPVAFGLTYGYNGETDPVAEVSFAQSALYLQDEWDVTDRFKLTYGIRADLMSYLTDLQTNEAYKALDWKDHFIAKNDPKYDNYEAPVIDTGKWPKASVLFSPRVGFNWDIIGDRSLVLRGGTGIFTGRIPLVFLTNMPTNAMMLQNTVSISNDKQGQLTALQQYAAKNNGAYPTNVNDMIEILGLPKTSAYTDANAPVSYATVAGVADDFKLPQVWKNSLAIDYRLPVSFPLTLTFEAMVNKDINAVSMENYNIVNVGNLERFAGPDNRYDYSSWSGKNGTIQSGVTSGAVVLKNTSKGHSSTVNAMVTAQPIPDLNLMFSYTHTVSKELTGLPGNQAYSSWQNLYSVDGPNEVGLSNSQYVTPNKVIASASYRIKEGKNFATNIGLYYAGYNSGMFSYYYANDMNGDGAAYDLMYIPKTKDELNFIDANLKDGSIVTAETQRDIFWKFIEQDDYLSSHKGEYAKAYDVKMPWVHRFDLKIAQDFKLKVGKSMNTLQVSLDILNIGNLLNDAWGVTKTNSSCNYGKLLNYLGKTADNQPKYSLYAYDKSNKYYKSPTLNEKSTTFTNYNNSSNCWQLQIGVRYIFN